MKRPHLCLNVPDMRAAGYLISALLMAAFAVADVPESRRSEAAIQRVQGDLKHDLGAQGLEYGAPIFIQITKIPAELTVFVQNADGTFDPFRTYEICSYSGGLGPKKREGDGKSPEGFYRVRAQQMNPASSYHLSFNLGYPNAFDRRQGYTGDYLMVHGRCVSIGCYAMTDPVMDEIWTLMAASFQHGQGEIGVHIFPYKMNWPMRSVPPNHPDRAFWQTLAPAWKAFTQDQVPPRITVAGGQYIVEPASQ